MSFHTTDIPGLLIFEPRIFEDHRGYFYEAYSDKIFSEAGVDHRFVQDNQSSSKYGVIRGLHFQLHPHAQTKLVRVLAGTIIDAVVDIRKGSPTYGQSFTIELSDTNKKQLLIPCGFAHGFSVISQSATILYKCDAFWNKESEGGIRYNDPALEIDWGVPANKAILIDKDLALPTLSACMHNFVF